MAEGEIIDVDGGTTEEGIRTSQEGIMAEEDTIDSTVRGERLEEETIIVDREEDITRTGEEETGIKIGTHIETEDGTEETIQTRAEDPSETTPTKGVKKQFF